jgi:tRNA A37 threonylcarbamoyladenosine synthetase subunit TsaC/SUA5/YrdC
MATATVGTARLTSDPVAPDQLKSDIGRLFDALAAGGIGLVPLDVAYAVIATTPSGIRRIFEVKRRSYEKPSGMFGSWRMSRDIHLMDDERHAMVREIIEQEKIPFSIVAPSVRSRRSIRSTELVKGRHARHAAQCRPVP